MRNIEIRRLVRQRETLPIAHHQNGPEGRRDVVLAEAYFTLQYRIASGCAGWSEWRDVEDVADPAMEPPEC